MTTNSKNSRMRYHGFNNNRMYRASLRIKRDNKKFERTLSKGLSCIGRTFGFLITNATLCFSHKNREAEIEQQAVEKKIVREEQRIQKQATYNKKKKKEQENSQLSSITEPIPDTGSYPVPEEDAIQTTSSFPEIDFEETEPYEEKISMYEEIIQMDLHHLAVFLFECQSENLTVSEWEEKLRGKDEF